jgi:hypothetical protein
MAWRPPFSRVPHERLESLPRLTGDPDPPPTGAHQQLDSTGVRMSRIDECRHGPALRGTLSSSSRTSPRNGKARYLYRLRDRVARSRMKSLGAWSVMAVVERLAIGN